MKLISYIFTCAHSKDQLNSMASSALKVLGHGHVFVVSILISSGSDIIIQIRIRGFGVI